MKQKWIEKSAALLLLNLLVLLSSCSDSKKPLSKSELINYVQSASHGLSKTLYNGDVSIRLNFQPSSLLVAQELEMEDIQDTAAIARLEKKYGDQYYFLLQLSHKGKEAIREVGSFSKYSEMVQLLSFGLHNFVILTTLQKDTIPLSDYHFDNMYGNSNANSILLVFNKEKLRNKDYLEINISEFGLGAGSMKFQFDRNRIERVPPLDYKKS